jgi:hypothetical protein
LTPGRDLRVEIRGRRTALLPGEDALDGRVEGNQADGALTPTLSRKLAASGAGTIVGADQTIRAWLRSFSANVRSGLESKFSFSWLLTRGLSFGEVNPGRAL